MNHVEISGTILEQPKFAEPNAILIGTFVLVAGAGDATIRVVALDWAARQLQSYGAGDTVKVSGRLAWQSGGVEIWADQFKQHHEGAYRKENEWRSRVLPKVKGF